MLNRVNSKKVFFENHDIQTTMTCFYTFQNEPYSNGKIFIENSYLKIFNENFV